MRQVFAFSFSNTIRLLVLSFCLTGPAHGESTNLSDRGIIEGSVWYRERMALPTNAEIHIFLEDVARMDVPSDVIATTSFTPQGGPPWAFSLAYDPGKLHDRGRYVLRVRIEADGRLLFINTESIPAFGRDSEMPLEILVSRVPESRRDVDNNVPDVSLTDTYWKLTEIDGQPATLGAVGREVHMVLTSEGHQVHGFSGCNRFTGSYERDESQLRFRPLASTRMACLEGMDQEQRFLELLTKTMRFTINSDNLALYSGDEQLVFHFKAIALK